LSTPLNIGAWNETEFVEGEEDIRAHAKYALHNPVEKVVHRLGVSGRFRIPRGAIIGEPDYSWVASIEQPHHKLIVRIPTMWICPQSTCVAIVTLLADNPWMPSNKSMGT
jgi:hypothetical protein